MRLGPALLVVLLMGLFHYSPPTDDDLARQKIVKDALQEARVVYTTMENATDNADVKRRARRAVLAVDHAFENVNEKHLMSAKLKAYQSHWS
ncbi:MAG TPA: hypothetical protein VFA18_05050, partial [Gemmataceae bacterium]|nr:hypothetical protein [Gemmataceae bacterium]